MKPMVEMIIDGDGDEDMGIGNLQWCLFVFGTETKINCSDTNIDVGRSKKILKKKENPRHPP